MIFLRTIDLTTGQDLRAILFAYLGPFSRIVVVVIWVTGGKLVLRNVQVVLPILVTDMACVVL